MLAARCLCPRCGTTLRVKDRSYLNRSIPCPACRALLELTLTESNRLTAALQDSEVRSEDSKSGFERSRSGGTRSWTPWTTNITLASWAATLLVAAMIGILIWRRDRPRNRSPEAPSIEQTAESPDVDSEAILLESDLLRDKPLDEVPVAVQPEEEIPQTPAVRDLPADVAPVDAMAVLSREAPAAQPLPPAPMPAELPAVDFDKALSQPLAAFNQPRAIPRAELLEQLEEMLGAPIRYDADELGTTAQRLDEKIAFELHNTTVGDVLARILDQTGIVTVQERQALRLRATEPIPAADEKP